jgi:aminoglycoside 3-N-acetyltransferase
MLQILKSRASALLTPRVVNLLKSRVSQLRTAYIRRFRAFSDADIEQALRQLGVSNGSVVFCHSSWDAFQGYTGSPADAVRCLQRVVGDSGTIAMPTLSFDGSAIEYARTQPVFNVKRTPSKTGLLTEVFRRSPDVQRSLHPTHSVAAWGAQRDLLLDAHERATTPCGDPSPYSRLADVNAVIVFLGTPFGVLTYFHALEEDIEALMPFSPFTVEQFTLLGKDYHGQSFAVQTRLYEPAVSARRSLDDLYTSLRDAGDAKVAHCGRLRLIAVKATAIREAVRAMAARGQFCYRAPA